MRKYAIIDNNIVVKVLNLSETEIQTEVEYHSMVLDIEDLIPCPEVGWILEGNTLRFIKSNLTSEQLDDIQQESQQKFGQKILVPYINRLGSRNLKLARDGVPVDVSVMASQMSLLKLLLETGALKTARGLTYQMATVHVNHSDILNLIIAEITNFLSNQGWN